MEKRNIKKLIISVICTLVLLIGGTYAAWNFLTEKTDITVLVDGDQISFDAGVDVTVDNLLPVYSMYSETNVITKDVEIYKQNGEYTAGIDLYLKLTTWPTVFSSSSFRWALYKNGNYLSSGDFSSTSQGTSIKLTSNIQKINLYEDKDDYKLYLWIDAYQESNINMMNSSFTVSLYGKVSFYDRGEDVVFEEVEPNSPELADGMIPIRYNYTIDEWEKADSTNTNNNWYDYYNKMWANMVLVTSESRDRYMSANPGTTIEEKDILAYYVWIPRYKYLLFNVDSEAINPREIQIVFEKTTDLISQGDENGEYLSHPAFWWDNNSNDLREEGEELSGIWVGKFEMSADANNPKFLPNATSVILSVSGAFNRIKKIENTIYLTEIGVSEIDSHMIKNTEWGAVAYLSHSRYGIKKEIKINNNSNQVTGRQGNYTYNDYLISDGAITLNKSVGTGTLASTTGNIYGIYDMNGGVDEYVMAVRKTSATDDTPKYYESGFNENTMPESKYYNLYEYVSSTYDYSKRILGDATGETNGWYVDVKKFISSYGWVSRGGRYNSGQLGGSFNFDSDIYTGTGKAYMSGSRGVIVLP